MRTRSPVLNDGVASWVMTCTVPLSIRKVMRYIRSEAIELPVVPAALAPPTLPAPVPAPPLWRGMISILVTVLLGALLLAEGMDPVPEPYWLALDEPVAALPLLPMASLPADSVDPVAPVEPLVPDVDVSAVLPMVSLLVPVEEHAPSPRASTPANSTPSSLRFMINSFDWLLQSVRDRVACHFRYECTIGAMFCLIRSVMSQIKLGAGDEPCVAACCARRLPTLDLSQTTCERRAQ
jgi:hypothetical protein